MATLPLQDGAALDAELEIHRGHSRVLLELLSSRQAQCSARLDTMPATEQTWRDSKLMHVVFGISALAMLVTTVWMLAADHRREWKDYQRKFQRRRSLDHAGPHQPGGEQEYRRGAARAGSRSWQRTREVVPERRSSTSSRKRWPADAERARSARAGLSRGSTTPTPRWWPSGRRDRRPLRDKLDGRNGRVHHAGQVPRRPVGHGARNSWRPTRKSPAASTTWAWATNCRKPSSPSCKTKVDEQIASVSRRPTTQLQNATDLSQAAGSDPGRDDRRGGRGARSSSTIIERS